MIEPVSPTEQMMYCTVRIVAHLKDGSTSTGSGFLYEFQVEGGRRWFPTLITNNHVIEGAKQIEFVLHTVSKADGKKPDGKKILRCTPDAWTPHPNPKVDLCALPVGGTLSAANPSFFYRTINPTLVPSDQQLEELTAVEDVLMIGYPNGLWDATNNYPLIRRGITASHPAVDFDIDGVPTTVVDIACFPGSSGSPVIVFNEHISGDKKGNVKIGSRGLFLGVLFSGPVMEADGEIVIRNIPTIQVAVPQVRLMLNLGYVIKSKELASLGTAVLQKNGVKAPTKTP